MNPKYLSTNTSFYNLKPDHILDRLDKNGFKTSGHILALNSLENRVYRVGLEDQSNVVVKCYRPGRWSKEQIQEEHDFIFELQKGGLQVLPPIPFANGSTISTEEDGIPYSIWPLNTGRIVEEFSIDDLPIIGRMLATLHNISDGKSTKTRIPISLQDYAKPALNFILQNGNLSSSLKKYYEQIARATFQEYEHLEHFVPFQRIHGDCHKGNILSSKDGFVFIDFDDHCMGPIVQDFWMLLPFGDESSIQERQIFLEAYKEFRPINESWFRLIPSLRGIRYIYYSAWILKRWEDPSFPNAFPHFGTEEYWEKEVRDLESLLAGKDDSNFPSLKEAEEKFSLDETLDQGEAYGNSESNDIANSVPSKKKPEITNKDLFWDWEGE